MSKFRFSCSSLLMLTTSVGLTAQPRPPQPPPPAPATQAKDPGVRTGNPGAGGALTNLTTAQKVYFQKGSAVFEEVDAVSNGLGPTFNLDSCAGCHAQPAIGGSSPAVNPQPAAAIRNGATNRVPPFITADGPIRVVRFKSDGGVHALFTVAGRADAPGCTAAQPDFAGAQAANNVTFRIPTPVFGAGLIEGIPDSAILANLAASPQQKQSFGISGHPNHNGNDGTITRFGWKAQNKSLLLFSGEAYNVEMGVTNELFPNERNATPGCLYNNLPEDYTHTEAALATDVSSDIVNFSNFMRYLAPAMPAPFDASASRGQGVFAQIGCALCHTPTLGQPAVNAYSDLVVHHMGQALADGITQSEAGPDEWRTAPLWGVGQRIFFLHDGRTRDLVEAIRDHRSPQSEATAAINAFDALPSQAQQDLLNFLRAL